MIYAEEYQKANKITFAEFHYLSVITIINNYYCCHEIIYDLHTIVG